MKNVRIRSFSGPDAAKYGPEKIRIRTQFTQWNAKALQNGIGTSHKTKFSVIYLNECEQIRRNLRIFSHLLNTSPPENFIFCSV